MARISFGPTPWSVGGGLAGGLAEGLAVGQGLSNQRQQMELQKQQVESQKTGQYFKMLEAAVKAGDVAPEVANALMQMASQGLSGGAPGSAPNIPQFPSLAEQQQRKFAELDKIMHDPSLSQADKSVRLQALGLKPQAATVMVPVPMPDGSTQMMEMTEEKAAQMLTQIEGRKDLAMLAASLKEGLRGSRGGGGGGGGAKGLIPWQGPNGEFLGYAPKTAPPTKDARPATAGSFKPPDAPVPLPWADTERLDKIRTKMAANKKLEPGEAAFYQQHGGKYENFPGASLVQPPSFTKPPKKKAGAAQAPPVQMYEAPPPPDEE